MYIQSIFKVRHWYKENIDILVVWQGIWDTDFITWFNTLAATEIGIVLGISGNSLIIFDIKILYNLIAGLENIKK